MPFGKCPICGGVTHANIGGDYAAWHKKRGVKPVEFAPMPCAKHWKECKDAKEREEEAGREKRIEDLAAAEYEDWLGDCKRREYEKSEEYAEKKKLAEEFAKR